MVFIATTHECETALDKKFGNAVLAFMTNSFHKHVM